MEYEMGVIFVDENILQEIKKIPNIKIDIKPIDRRTLQLMCEDDTVFEGGIGEEEKIIVKKFLYYLVNEKELHNIPLDQTSFECFRTRRCAATIVLVTKEPAFYLVTLS